MQNSDDRSVGFLGLLTLLFIGLKLTNYIDWEWYWVLSPLWLPFAVFFGIIIVAMFVAFVASALVALFIK